MATHPNARIRYYASDMVLNVHSNTSYLSVKDAKSRAARIFYLGSLPKSNQPIKLNGAITVLCAILKFMAWPPPLLKPSLVLSFSIQKRQKS
eukprot:CCRYP_015821-RA/>CCRYP_015821-RA protein AED:0.46 eAED:0.46 QI:0/-1/0/1/-1/1/1/0/91